MVHHVVKRVMSLLVSLWLDILISSCKSNMIWPFVSQSHWTKHSLDLTEYCLRTWMVARSKCSILQAMSLIHSPKSIFVVKECPLPMIHHAKAIWLSRLTSNFLASWLWHHPKRNSLSRFLVNKTTFPQYHLNVYLMMALATIVLQTLHPLQVMLVLYMNEPL